MQCYEQENTSDEEINMIIDNMLAEDQREKLHKNEDSYKQSEEQFCKTNDHEKELKKQHAGVIKSKRFSLYVMEAMRALQRQKKTKQSSLSKSSTICEIIGYIQTNFSCDGDIDAQVRTALKQICWQGFVKNQGKNKYCLIGPVADQLHNDKNVNFVKSPCTLVNEKCHCNINTPNTTQESIEANLSAISSFEEDSFCHDINSKIKNTNHTIRPCDNNMKQTMNLNLDKHKQSLGQKNKYRSCSSPRKYSSAKEDSDIVGYINNPTSEIETDIRRPETIELCDDSIKADLCTESNQEIIDTSDDSILQEMKKKSQRPNDQTRDRDLKKWIRHCRREYAQQTCNTAEKNSQK